MNRFHRTARSRANWSKPTQWLYENGYLDYSVFDYGCGRGKDIEVLRDKGLMVGGYDPYTTDKQFQKLTDMFDYDCVICNYVLNVVNELDAIEDIFRKLEKKKTRNGRIFVSVRADKQSVKDSWEPCGDGWLTANQTFQRFYDVPMVEKLAKDLNRKFKIMRKNSSYIIFEVLA